ncbi:MAG: 4Fe-4S dicluster domain-containing protein [Candidatus Eisenbacteria bacterium]|uniref:4Fe-4S dicluster domain-containing protein n=1 Tax=Eiseniibacteriota bacterium TaxID=2212470 RepID=A0A948S1F2_UNCEI|nr:4Fe-4S dicluster domain-containing protein [Candidatus Eisenbacteria bacterium]MBU1947393.1 4Fe-4S dicluster domain-containing protein [Candidatus Eisenbacteria bacterium]MBU2692074.1 4Fe-4S dicluster domain-containing protein [Candidatus Eisenbacteria bacterium]
MTRLMLEQGRVDDFIRHLQAQRPVYAPRRKGQSSYVFAPVDDPNDVVLDYPRTLHSVKKYFLPPREELLNFNLKANSYGQPEIETANAIMLGVHSYDMHAVLRLDYNLAKGNKERNYFARRQGTLFIGVSFSPDKFHFSGSLGISPYDTTGFDLFLYKVDKGFALEIITAMGEKLLSGFDLPALGVPLPPHGEFQQHIYVPQSKLSEVFDHSQENAVWEEEAARCVSCGTCNMVCPTCYCFDVEDEVDVRVVEGTRNRRWDACMLRDFTEVAGGEVFRHKSAARQRHRVYRKFKYISDHTGEPWCVGCGRCTAYCTANISIVSIVNRLVNDYEKDSTARLPQTQPIIDRAREGHSDPAGEAKDLYSPVMAEIKSVQQMTDLEKLFEIQLPDGAELNHKPGQFVELSLFGAGEAPISISSSPAKKGVFDLGIRKVGRLTEMMHRLQPGDRVGIRGPFGNGFDLEKLKGKDVLIIAGGIGLVPLRSLINTVIADREAYGRLIICYGSKSDQELLFGNERKMWDEDPSIEFHVTVDRGSPDWTGKIGVITTLIPELALDLERTIACICGPPIMYRFVLLALKSKRFPEENIYLSLERRMKCGVGKCGHCQINNSYVCQDGPVYHYPAIKGLKEAL